MGDAIAARRGLPCLLALLALSLLAAVHAVPVDTSDMCEMWASSGECDANPDYMRQNCAASCAGAKAKPGGYASQMKRECVGYARQGECSRNPAFMLSTCRAECDAWEAENGLRIDRNARCVEWSLLGKCAEEPARMAAECNTSCTVQERCARSARSGWSVGICDKALRCEAVDKDRDCAARAAAGECRTQTSRMADRCMQTCAAADVDGLLSAQDAEHRAIHSALIDVPSTEARRSERCWLNGWAGHNTYKLMLPTQCAAPRTLPWQRHGVPASRLAGRDADLLTCPHDVAKQTPRVAYPTVNVTLLPHTPHVVRVQQVLASPRVRLLHDFITAEEGAELLRLAEPSFHRSPVRSVATDRRTSSTATLMTRGNWAVTRVRERIAAFSGYNENALEPLQVVRYHPGEKYEPHHDLFDLCDLPQKPRRHLTFLIYLNTMDENAGAHTTFPRLKVSIPPKAGTALVFNDVLDNGHDDERTEHGGAAPAAGVKYAINCWIRARSPDRASWMPKGEEGLFNRLAGGLMGA